MGRASEVDFISPIATGTEPLMAGNGYMVFSKSSTSPDFNWELTLVDATSLVPQWSTTVAQAPGVVPFFGREPLFRLGGDDLPVPTSTPPDRYDAAPAAWPGAQPSRRAATATLPLARILAACSIMLGDHMCNPLLYGRNLPCKSAKRTTKNHMIMTKTKRPTIGSALGMGLGMLLLIPHGAAAQSTVNASGHSGTIAGNTFAYSIGEMTVVSTVVAETFLVTQGVMQAGPDATIGVQELDNAAAQITLYPNPVSDRLYLHPELSAGSGLLIRLLDVDGRLLMERQARLGTGSEEQEIDMAPYAEGSYLLQAVVRHNDHEFQKTFQVLKAAVRR